MSDPPLNLAGVTNVNVDDSLMDPTSLAVASDFFATAQEHKFDDELTAAAVAAAAEAVAQQQHNDAIGLHALDVGNVGVDVGDMGVGNVDVDVNVGDMGVGPSVPTTLAEHPPLQMSLPDTNGELTTIDGISAAHLAPFARPQRGEGTPHPEVLSFANRAEFEVWFEGESSWCHFVQRRTTTPEKRADERLRARIKAHERMLASMTPEEAASAPPLKRRRRTRTSSIKEKVTFTCHHAGRYEAKHSTTLPREKLRMNTKKSVKCDCPARIVLTEMEDGDCKVSYYWRHEGHDAYADDELESGRLPKVIDEWLVAQIEAGKDTDEIRRSLMMTDEEKATYLREIAEDPSRIDPEKPPPLALTLRIKYPDIYNRFRKLRGPIKEFKPPKNPRSRKRPASVKEDLADVSVTPVLPLEQQDLPYPSVEGPQPMVEGFSLGDAMDGNLPAEFTLPHDLNASELGTQEGLARVLLALPRGHGESEADNAALSEAVLRIASENEMKEREWVGVDLPPV